VPYLLRQSRCTVLANTTCLLVLAPLRLGSNFSHSVAYWPGAGPFPCGDVLSEPGTTSNLIILLDIRAATTPRHGNAIASTECSARATTAAPHGIAFIAYSLNITPRTRRRRAPQIGHTNDTAPGTTRLRRSTLITTVTSLRDPQDGQTAFALIVHQHADRYTGSSAEPCSAVIAAPTEIIVQHFLRKSRDRGVSLSTRRLRLLAAADTCSMVRYQHRDYQRKPEPHHERSKSEIQWITVT
jgi:hypothetical protein